MGLLDEAIREHLELKRRRGADPTEVDRLEREALGPVRRSPHDPSDVLSDEESALPGDYPAEETEPGWSEEDEDIAPFDHSPVADGPPSAGGLAEPEPSREFEMEPASGFEPEPDTEQDRTPGPPRHHEIAEERETHDRQGMVGEPSGFEPDEPGPAPPAPHSVQVRPSFEEETAEFAVEEEGDVERRSAEPSDEEDVLEETPDFLQDTPDHDRLWFEQRQPRDFDFDG
jgi:hypothetical protein